MEATAGTAGTADRARRSGDRTVDEQVDQRDELAVAGDLAQPLQHRPAGNRAEAVVHIGAGHEQAPGLAGRDQRPDRVLHAQAPPVREAPRRQQRIDDPVELDEKSSLDDPIVHRADAERPDAAIGLGDLYRGDRSRLPGATAERLGEAGQPGERAPLERQHGRSRIAVGVRALPDLLPRREQRRLLTHPLDPLSHGRHARPPASFPSRFRAAPTSVGRVGGRTWQPRWQAGRCRPRRSRYDPIPVGDAELLDQVRQLRGEGRTPKQIARALGMPPSAVAPLVRAVAAQRRAPAGEQQVVGCWVNAGWSLGLSVDHSRGWTDETPSEDGTGGLVSVLVARRHRWDKVLVCGYLVDVYCLGVKNVRSPGIDDEPALRRLLPDYYAAYPHGWQDAPIELAQHIVFGAVEYARGLGFEPAADFVQAAHHLGAWEGPGAITFGKEGKPFYISGPRDNPRKVVETLEHAVGPPPNFNYVVMQAAPRGFTAAD